MESEKKVDEDPSTSWVYKSRKEQLIYLEENNIPHDPQATLEVLRKQIVKALKVKRQGKLSKQDDRSS